MQESPFTLKPFQKVIGEKEDIWIYIYLGLLRIKDIFLSILV